MHERHWGEKAHNDGLGRDRCPYTGGEARRQWMMGWDNAKRIAEAKQEAVAK